MLQDAKEKWKIAARPDFLKDKNDVWNTITEHTFEQPGLVFNTSKHPCLLSKPNGPTAILSNFGLGEAVGKGLDAFLSNDHENLIKTWIEGKQAIMPHPKMVPVSSPFIIIVTPRFTQYIVWTVAPIFFTGFFGFD